MDSHKRKLVLCSWSLTIGGIERMVIELAARFTALGYETYILTMEPTTAYSVPNEVNRIQVDEPLIREKFIYRCVRKLAYVQSDIEKKLRFSDTLKRHEKRMEKLALTVHRKAIREALKPIGRPENITVISYGWQLNNLVITSLYGKGYRVIAHQDSVPGKGSGGNVELQSTMKIYPKAHAVIALTNDMRMYYSKSVCEKCIVIPNPIPKNLPCAFEGSRKKEIVTFCRIAPRKNLTMLIEAFALLHEKYSDYELTIYGNYEGEGVEYNSNICELIKSKGLSDFARVLPFDPAVHEKVVDSAMFVQTSWEEGFGNSLFEAMAIGLPVISTDCPCGAPKEYIRNYENGILVPVGDVFTLSQAMEWIIVHPHEAMLMSREAVRIKEVLGIDAIINEYEKAI